MARVFALVALTVGACGFALPVSATNPPQISYVQTIAGNNRPLTYFKPGWTVKFKAVLYDTNHQDALDAVAHWLVTSGKRHILSKTVKGHVSGPTRGDLFSTTITMRLSKAASNGEYTATFTVTLDRHHLSRSEHFWVRR